MKIGNEILDYKKLVSWGYIYRRVEPYGSCIDITDKIGYPGICIYIL